jgi:hypothetical protein
MPMLQRTLPRQLPLPLTLPHMNDAALLLPGGRMVPHTVWTSLSALEQARFRQTLLTVLLEVARVRDAG